MRAARISSTDKVPHAMTKSVTICNRTGSSVIASARSGRSPCPRTFGRRPASVETSNPSGAIHSDRALLVSKNKAPLCPFEPSARSNVPVKAILLPSTVRLDAVFASEMLRIPISPRDFSSPASVMPLPFKSRQIDSFEKMASLASIFPSPLPSWVASTV